MSISELAEKSGVSVRTVRFYVSEGLLPRPKQRGRYASYDHTYLKRLQVINLLKAAFLPLKEVRARLSGLSDAGIDALVDELTRRDDLSSKSSGVRAESRPERAEAESYDREASDRGEAWARYELEYGLELNVLAGLPPWRERIVRRILAAIDLELRDW